MRRFLVLFVTLAAVAVAPGPARAAGWGWPLPAPHQVVRGFDPPAEPWLSGHRGVDLAGRPGETVRSAGAGLVVFAGRVAGVPVVSVRHPGGLLTTYEPTRPAVGAGERVALGQRIGWLARGGGHCSPRACLHWGLRRGSVYLDPLTLLGLGGVRLLPLAHPGSWVLPGASGVSVGAGSAVAGALLVSRRRRSSRRRPAPNRSACRRSPAPSTR
jgi:murein DD-endopeptidase MepM/ murein hydrolase activator NlpD